MLTGLEEILIPSSHSPDKIPLFCDISYIPQKCSLLNAHRAWQLFFHTAGNIFFLVYIP